MPTVLSIDAGAHQSREWMLAKNGYQVLHAGNLHQALECFRSSTVDVVVFDAGSSVSTIFPFTRLLKAAKPDIPLLLITDNAADADDEPEAACFNAVISRLDGPVLLLERLRELIALISLIPSSNRVVVKRHSRKLGESAEYRNKSTNQRAI